MSQANARTLNVAIKLVVDQLNDEEYDVLAAAFDAFSASGGHLDTSELTVELLMQQPAVVAAFKEFCAGVIGVIQQVEEEND